MTGKEFKAWREAFGLTQLELANKVRVSRTTIQTWENVGADSVPLAALHIHQIWDRRLRQESPARGPLTLVYADGSMFIDPYQPRRRATMIQEPFPTNAAVLARVQQLSSRVDFHTPFVLENERDDLWNTAELNRVMRGDDRSAPTLQNMLRMIAETVRANPVYSVQGQTLVRENALGFANELESLGQNDLVDIVMNQGRIEQIFQEMIALGTSAPNALVSAVHFALVVFERNPIHSEAPKIVSAGNYVIDYRGYEITYQSPPMFPNRWVVNLSSASPHLFNRLERGNVIIEDVTLEDAVNKAKRYVDGLR